MYLRNTSLAVIRVLLALAEDFFIGCLSQFCGDINIVGFPDNHTLERFMTSDRLYIRVPLSVVFLIAFLTILSVSLLLLQGEGLYIDGKADCITVSLWR